MTSLYKDYNNLQTYNIQTYDNKVVSVLNICQFPNIACDRETYKLWDLDAIGIPELESLPSNYPIHTKFEKSIVFNSNHYIGGLPW